jgi:uncharacterized protein (DUF2267 family)
MNLDEFLGQVQHRAQLATTGQALSATRATLQVLGQRLAGGAPGDLAAELPNELREYLPDPGPGESFDLDEFFRRVSASEGVDLPVSIHHARVVIEVLQEAISPGAVSKVLDQLPDEYRPLFTSGSQGQMDTSVGRG